MKSYQPPASTPLPTELPVAGAASALAVNITAALSSVDVMHQGRKATIMRNQDQGDCVNCVDHGDRFAHARLCGQSPTNIKALLKIGYPAHKLPWYRGGMQDWENLGLTAVRPESE